MFRFTREEMLQRFPGASVRAAGFYTLPARLQNTIARWVGRPLGRLKIGHVLIVSGVKDSRLH